MVDRITSSQVAKRAGVSQSAVSRFYTPGASVSAKTAEKVVHETTDDQACTDAPARDFSTACWTC